MSCILKPPHTSLKALDREKILSVWETMFLARAVDGKMNILARQNKGGSFFLSTAGHEMVGAVCASFLLPGKDWAFPYYRDRAFVLGLGSSLVDIIGSFLTREVAHHSGGRMMPDHFSQKSLRIPCQSSCVGSQYLQAVGLAKGISLQGLDEVVYVSGGDGSTSQGDFHEALNFACIHSLPVIFVVQDNGWAISVCSKEQTAGGSIANRSRGYDNLSVHDVDGCDFFSLSRAMQESTAKARIGNGPSLIVANVPRLSSHTASDDQTRYKDAAIIAEEQKRDPLPIFEGWMLKEAITTTEELLERKEEALKKIEIASLEAEAVAFPKKEEVMKHLYKEYCVHSSSNEISSTPIVMMDAINRALVEEMQRDAGVLVFGEDVAHKKGGIFGVTKQLTQMFGEERCFNTPLAESTIVGVAIGLGFDGYHKPIAEVQYTDYVWPALNQLANELASIHHRSNGEWHCPVVVRMTCGGYIQGGPYHSQSLETIFAHVPGLKVAIPSNASDAKRLLKTAIRDPNPVIFLEHKALYRQHFFSARPETSPEDLLAFGEANIVKGGKDLTVIAWGMLVPMASSVADHLQKEGISVELIDLRTIVPLDMETILASVRKTGKVLIVHEAAKTCGFGAELSARIVEEAFMDLDAPVQRLGGKDCPVPYCKDLEDAVLPQKKDLEEAIRALYRF
jgi:2-oxoisovalerate dehydrogenase E1 component